MSEHPIIFSAPMVRAILEGRKTETRRLVKIPRACRKHHGDETHYGDGWWLGPHPVKGWWACFPGSPSKAMIADQMARGVKGFECPYGRPGDLLWVRETWCPKGDPITSKLLWKKDEETFEVHYRADGEEVICDDGDGFTTWNKNGSAKSPWCPSIHMPRWASRITLRVLDVRVERLQEIAEEGAQAEGVEFRGGYWRGGIHPIKKTMQCWPTARDAFARIWDAINGKRATWESNPWVWVLTFSVL